VYFVQVFMMRRLPWQESCRCLLCVFSPLQHGIIKGSNALFILMRSYFYFHCRFGQNQLYTRYKFLAYEWCDFLNIITFSMSEIVHGINLPIVSSSMIDGVETRYIKDPASTCFADDISILALNMTFAGYTIPSLQTSQILTTVDWFL
jgi:hypothetical protein